MSQGTALGKDDLFEKDVFKDAITGAQTLLTVIRETKEEIKGSLSVQKEFVSTFKAKSFDDVKKLNQELKQTSDLIKMKQQLEVAEIKVMEQQEKLAQTQIKTAIEKNRLNREQLKSDQDLTKAIEAETKANEKLAQTQIKTAIEKNKLTREQFKADQDLTKAIEAETKANEKAAKSLNVLNGQYKQGVKDLAAIKQQLKELEYTGRTNGKVYKALSQDFAALNDKVRGAEQSVGEFQRNVGNYASGFSPLSNSINQLTREMPAFANSVQTGFLAISNNIPAFFDAISGIKKANAELIAQGKPTTSVLSQLGTALFSWGTALSVGVTLLTVYGKEFVTFIGDLFKGEKAIVAVTEALTDNNKELTKLFEKRIDLELKLAVVQKKISQEESDRIKRGVDLRKALRDEETNYYKQRIKIADEFQIKLDARGNPLIAGGESGDITTNVKQREQEYYKAIEEVTKSHLKIMAELEKQAIVEEKIAKEEANKDLSKDEKKAQEKQLKDLEDYRKKREALMKKWAEIDAENDKETAKTKFKGLQGDIQELEQAWVTGYSRFEEAQRKAAKEFNISQDELMAEFFKSGIENFEEFLEKKRELMKKDQQLQKDVIAGVDKLVVNLDRIYKERFNRAKDYLDREIDLNKSAIEQQQRLAERGLTNTLAFEQAKAAKLQLERRRLQEQEIKQQKRVAFYNLLSGYAKTEPATALQKAILETTLAEVIAGNFIEGTENVERDLSGNKMHSGQDGYVIAVDGKERIFNPKQNAKIGDISNDEAAQILADYNSGKLFNYGDTVQPIIPVTKQVIDLSETNALLDKVINAVENIPGTNLDVDGLNNLILTTVRKGIKEITQFKQRRI